MAADQITLVEERGAHDGVLPSHVVVIVRDLGKVSRLVVAQRAADQRPESQRMRGSTSVF